MMKKNGFTLAEVLLSLGIVGIVAAVTLPTLILNVEKRKVGPSVMKAVNTLESASTLALQVNDARKLSEIKKGNKNKLSLCGEILEDFTKITKIPYSPKTGSTPSGDSYATKDGIVILDSGYQDDKGAYFVTIDINGERGPNKDGKDLFEMYVLEDGIVVPVGSYLYTQKIGGEYWQEKCKTVDKNIESTKGTPDNAKTCAGSIVDNGGRVLYDYDAIE